MVREHGWKRGRLTGWAPVQRPVLSLLWSRLRGSSNPLALSRGPPPHSSHTQPGCSVAGMRLPSGPFVKSCALLRCGEGWGLGWESISEGTAASASVPTEGLGRGHPADLRKAGWRLLLAGVTGKVTPQHASVSVSHLPGTRCLHITEPGPSLSSLEQIASLRGQSAPRERKRKETEPPLWPP